MVDKVANYPGHLCVVCVCVCVWIACDGWLVPSSQQVWHQLHCWCGQLWLLSFILWLGSHT